MRYSVYSPSRGVYDYYETPEKSVKNPEAGFLSGRSGAQTALGVASTAAGWQLPSNARPVGSGKEAQGMIATRNGGALGGVDIPGGGLGVAFGLGLLYLLFGRK